MLIKEKKLKKKKNQIVDLYSRKKRVTRKTIIWVWGVTTQCLQLYIYIKILQKDHRQKLGLTISLKLSISSIIMSQMLDKAKNFVAEKVVNVKKPEASISDVDFKRVSGDSVEYLAKVNMTNPYGHPIPICEISYTLKSAGR